MGRKEASRCEAAGERKHRSSCCCSNRQRAVWGTRSVLQPKAEGVGRVWTRRAGASPFPVDPKGERSSFRNAESIRKSITLSMAEHGPWVVSRCALDRQRASLAERCVTSSAGVLCLSEVKLGQER